MKTTYIYCLLDPRDGSIRYVGKSVQPHKRYWYHVNSKVKQNSWVNSWITHVKEAGFKPVMQILEMVTGDEWIAAERWWIEHLTAQGCKLCNLTNGGDGEAGRILAEVSRKKISAALKGHPVTSETRAKLAIAATEQYANWTEEQKEEHRLKSTRFHTPEEIAKQIAKQRGHSVSEETREKIRVKNKLHVISEEQKAQISATLKAKYAAGALPKTEKQIEQLKTFRRKTYTPWTDEQKDKHSEILKARLALLTPEQKRARVDKALAARGCA